MDKTPITLDRSCQLSFTYEELVCHSIDCWITGNKLAKAEPSGTKIILLTFVTSLMKQLSYLIHLVLCLKC